MNNSRTSPPKFLQNLPPYFFMVLHRLYGVDAPAYRSINHIIGRLQNITTPLSHLCRSNWPVKRSQLVVKHSLDSIALQ